ncbi:conserved hypothetical protein [uncultured Alphaproteobacteria bacterium]|jgi:hypothetical protein|uniref:DUF1178 family protein n=1 Tax=uncultured Alphaproteobacteria bacterium TaxID=91750 RepID=A0A212IXE3_9PROT|nr:conserved hypothetical protein [uncultured Alphaproteobacteria bacterium]
MIRFALKCACGHRFDSWFRDNAACEDLMAAGHLTCPACGGREVAKAPMAPFVASAREAERAAAETERDARLRRALLKLREAVERNSENVGGAFAEEARKIHYGEAPVRSIYGDATAEEAEELAEEEIPFARIPWASRGDS